MHLFYSAVMAGVMTGLGGAAFLGAEHREVGALLFSIGMFAALALGLPLYIGRCVCAICHNHGRFARCLSSCWATSWARSCVLVYGLAVALRGASVAGSPAGAALFSTAGAAPFAA